MGTVWRRVILGVLAAQAFLVGIWAGLAPRSFYDSFPGLGRSWVAGGGAYSEHLLRDVGTLSLALGVLTAAAALRPRLVHHGVCAAAWLVYGIPHLVYHYLSDHHLHGSDRWLSLAALAVDVVLPLLLLIPAASGRQAPGGPARLDPGGAGRVERAAGR